MNRRNLLAIPAIVPILWALAAPADEISFHVAKSDALTSEFETTVKLSLDEMRMVMNGEEKDAKMFDLEIDMTNVTSLHFSDTFHAVTGGRPTDFVRHFEKLVGNVETSQANSVRGSSDSNMDSESELDAVDVRFLWDPEVNAYGTSFVDPDTELDESLLNGLAARADLAGLLPGKNISKGDIWEASPTIIMDLMAPGGDVKLRPMEEELTGVDPLSNLTFGEMMGDVDGDVRCEYLGTKSVDGQNLAEIKILLDVSSDNDLTEVVKKKALDVGQEDVQVEIFSLDVAMAIKGEGILLWDVEAGHFSSFAFTGDLEQIIDLSMALFTNMSDMEMEQTITMSGSVSFDFSATGN